MTIARPLLLYPAVFALLTTQACTRGDANPETTARRFMELAAAGDVLAMSGMLVPSEAALLEQNSSALDDAGFSSTGIPSATVDSAGSARLSGDTAVVRVFLTVPNVEQIMPMMFSRLMAEGMDTTNLQERMKGEIAKLPRITRANDVTMVRVDGAWRISLSLADRAGVAQSRKAIMAAYRDDDLDAGAAAAARIIEIGGRRSDLVDSTTLALARDVLDAKELVPLIEVSASVDESWIGKRVDGYVRNKSDRDIRSVQIRLSDNSGRSTTVTVNRLPPGGRKDLFELTSLDGGKPKDVRVVWINLGAWDY